MNTRRPDYSWAHFSESHTDEWIREGMIEIAKSTEENDFWYCRSGDNLVVVARHGKRIEVYDTVIRRVISTNL